MLDFSDVGSTPTTGSSTMSKQSRLEQISKRRFERNILFILLGIIILVVVAFFYAIPLLINFSLYILNSKELILLYNVLFKDS